MEESEVKTPENRSELTGNNVKDNAKEHTFLLSELINSAQNVSRMGEREGPPPSPN